MPFFAVFGEQRVNFDDLPMTLWAEVAQETGVPWSEVYWAPAASATAGPLLLKKIAAFAGLDPPEPITARVLFDAWDYVAKDDLPASFEDGLPSPEAVPTTD